MKPLLIILSIILVMFLLKVFVLDQDNKNTAQVSSSSGTVRKANPKVPVDFYVANLQVQKNVVYASGTIIPNEEVEIKSEVSGRLDKLNIKEGSYISKGIITKGHGGGLKIDTKVGVGTDFIILLPE